MEQKTVVCPGDLLAAAEEYIAGSGTYEMDGRVYSSIVGYPNPNNSERVISVIPAKKVEHVSLNSIVYGMVTEIRHGSATVELSYIEHSAVPLDVDYDAVLSVDDRDNAVKMGDIIKARVVQTGSRIALSIRGHELGVVIGFCTRCRQILELKNNVLYCNFCERSELRKIASNYRNPDVL